MEEWEEVLNRNENSNNKAPNGQVVSTGTTSLVMGILGFLICGFIFGIIAIVMASKNTDPAQAGNATAGKILGVVSIIWAVLASIAIIIFLAAFASTTAGSYY